MGAPARNVESLHVHGEQLWEDKVGRHVRTGLGRSDTHRLVISGGIGGKTDILRRTESEQRTSL